jgi:hypothetical protein
MTSRLLKQLFHPFLMMLMLMPFRASANDIVETFEGTSSIEKGQAGEIGYATQSASLRFKTVWVQVVFEPLTIVKKG